MKSAEKRTWLPPESRRRLSVRGTSPQPVVESKFDAARDRSSAEDKQGESQQATAALKQKSSQMISPNTPFEAATEFSEGAASQRGLPLSSPAESHEVTSKPIQQPVSYSSPAEPAQEADLKKFFLEGTAGSFVKCLLRYAEKMKKPTR